MLIAIVLNTSWNIYNFRRGLITAFLKTGYRVLAIAPYDEHSEKLQALGCDFVPIKMQNTGSNPLKDLLLLAELKNIYKKYKPSVTLHFTIKPNIYGTIAAESLNIPCINNVSGLGTVFLSHSLSSRIAILLYRYSFKKASRIFFQNADDKTDFCSVVNINNVKTDLLPGSGIDLSTNEPQYKKRESRFVFLMIGRIIIDKGVLEYIEAIRLLKSQGLNITCQLLGQIDSSHVRGISNEQVESWVSDDLIDYLGTTDDVNSVIKEADCVVLPSYREGTPRTLLEACAIGKPIITTNVPGCKEVVINEYNGYLCDAKSVDSLMNSMLKMSNLADSELQKMGEYGRKLVSDKYDEKIVVNKYLTAIREIMN